MGDIQFEPMAFVENLKYMGFGMLGIFVVIGVIAGVTVLLNYLASPKKKKEDK
ncbi:MAG: hypothetical protein IJW55_03670 [Clostridia bacterium]|nr:hypothetical protein [Clostridia bacterium]